MNYSITSLINAPSEELYRFGADGNLRLYSYDRLFYSLYGYDGGTTRTYKYSFDLNPNWVNGRLESVIFSMHNAMFYPNSYLNFNNDGHYTKHYYNGMERIASRLGDRNISINVSDPDLQDRKDWQDSLIRKNVTEITGYQFLEPGQEQDPDDPKPVFELPQVGLTNLIPNTSSVYYYHPNHLGSTCYVTDENAIVQQGFLYAPFGEITNEHNSSFGSSVLPKYSFNAKELDEETGMYYYEARYMAPPVFISRDPLFEKYPTFSPYAYCANNPVKFIDPTGEEFGDFYDEYGIYLGTDGKEDHRIYQTTRVAWNKHVSYSTAQDVTGVAGLALSKYDNLKADPETYYLGETNEFGLLQLTKIGNPKIINNEETEDTYSYTTKSGVKSPQGQHGDDWAAPSLAAAFNYAVNQTGVTVVVNDVSAYDGVTNLGHKSHRNGLCVDFRYITEDGKGFSNYLHLTPAQVKLNNTFLEALHNAGYRSISGGGAINSKLSDPSIHYNHIHIDRKY